MTSLPPLDPAALYRVLAESAQDAIVTIDESSIVLSVNPAAERLFGLPADQLIGASLTRVMPERMRASHRAGIQRYLTTGQRHVDWSSVRVPVITANGSEATVDISFGEFTSGGRRIFSAILRDVTDRIAAEDALAASAELLQSQAIELEQQVEEAQAIGEELEQTNEELRQANVALEEARDDAERGAARVREVLDSLTDAVSVFDHAWRWTYVNPGARTVLRTLDRDPDAVMGRVLWEVLPELLGTKFESETRRAVDENAPVSYEEYLPAIDRWFENRIVPSPSGITTFTRDVTDQHEAAESLRHREEEFRSLANSIPTLAWMANADGWIFWYNERWYQYTGTTPEQMEGWGWQSVHDPEMLPSVIELWTHSIATGDPFEMTFPLRGADGHFRRFLTRVVPVRDEAGRVNRWFGTNTDVEAERLSREEAVQAVARTQRLQSLTAALAATVTPEQVADVVVSQMADAVGAHTASLFVRVPGTDTAITLRQTGLDEETRSQYAAFPLDLPSPSAECLRTGEPVFLRGREGPGGILERYPPLRGVAERLGVEAVATVPLTLGDEVIGAMSFSFQDPRLLPAPDREFLLAVGRQAAQALDRARLISSEREAREEAEGANRVKAQFLATMSHELRTPLNAIGGYTQLLQLGIHGQMSAPQQEALERIQRSQRHLIALINDLLNFARLEAGQVTYTLADVPLRDALDALETLVSPQLAAKQLGFARDECADARVVRADPDKLQQILVNLLSNAIKFTPEGGSIDIACRRAGDDVAIAVRDTGIGIADDRVQQIFTPFVQIDRRLNTQNDGVGLGLSISRDLARGMGGDLSVESEPGAGSTFTLTLPRVQ